MNLQAIPRISGKLLQLLALKTIIKKTKLHNKKSYIDNIQTKHYFCTMQAE